MWRQIRFARAGKGRAEYPLVQRGRAFAGKAGPEPGAGSRILGAGRRAATSAEMHTAERSGRSKLMALRKCTYAGWPLGGSRSVTSIEGKFQRKWRKGPAYSVAEVAMSA